MAAKGSSFPLLKIQEQLTCGKCHNLYTNPKTLSCHHSFCQQCIEGLPTIPTLFVACPTCHQHTDLPDHAGPAGFSVSPHLLEFKQIYEEMRKLSGEVKCDNCSNPSANGMLLIIIIIVFKSLLMMASTCHSLAMKELVLDNLRVHQVLQ